MLRIAKSWIPLALLAAAPGCHRSGAERVSVSSAAAAAPAPLAFNRDIEPILSENCYQCHGPDPGGRKAGLRLDEAKFAFARREKGGPAIVPGDPDHSQLVRRVESADPKQMMPPLEAHKTLRPPQVALLRRWIREGAPYQPHWSFIAPQRPPVPATRRSDWARNPIDAFILARLEREGLAPSPEADRAALIRRVTYDLTGLPPTPAEAEAFTRDPAPDAYEKVVDRLLASPRYGEHRAHYWLDLARYGDTHGLHADGFRSMWPFRDYVITAYNRNKPFDRFLREQLAGDLLPAENLDQLVASAFVRAGVSTGEGGSILEELRVNNQRERTEAFGAVFLGLTTGCAVCHDHKFDPITQRDFYQLSAFFNNIDENPSDDNRANWPPMIDVPKPERREAYDAVLKRRAAIQSGIDARLLRARELVSSWLAAGGGRPRAVAPTALEVRLRLDEDAGSVLANSAPGAALRRVTATGGHPIWGEVTWLWPSFRMDTSTRLEMPAAGDVESDQPFSVGAWLTPHYEDNATRAPQHGAIVSRTRGSRGWELVYDQGMLSFRLIHAWPENLILVDTAGAVLRGNRWDHILATYDGSGHAAGVRIYIDGAPAKLAVRRDSLHGTVRTLAPLEFGRETPDINTLRQSRYQDFRFYRRALSAAEAARLPYEDHVAETLRRPPAQWSDDEFKAVSDFYFARIDEPVRAAAAKLIPLDAQLAELSVGGDPCLVCRESTQLPYADILVRGVYSQRGERVRPGVPHFLPQLPSGAPLNRRSLADWVVSPANPLTARVAVNRMWQELFGAGLVETSEDFGLMGDRPSHPELLDWLAVDFRENGWNVKRFYKELVMSATYRQSARITPASLEKDPRNRLLARGPRFRMDAEMLRDTALAASGLLVEKVGGPSVKPYQPPGVWESGATLSSNTFYYVMDHGDSLHRRSLYTFWKRMVLMPNMDTFDAPARDGSCTRRNRSDTPLQALVAMNDPQWLEAARCLGERLALHPGTARDRLDYLGELLLARPWPEREERILDRALGRFQAAYAGRSDAAAKLVAVGESHPDPRISPAQLAPWMLVASAALNLDATLNK